MIEHKTKYNKKQSKLNTKTSFESKRPTKSKGYSDDQDFFYYNTSTDEKEAIQSLDVQYKVDYYEF